MIETTPIGGYAVHHGRKPGNHQSVPIEITSDRFSKVHIFSQVPRLGGTHVKIGQIRTDTTIVGGFDQLAERLGNVLRLSENGIKSPGHERNTPFTEIIRIHRVLAGRIP